MVTAILYLLELGKKKRSVSFEREERFSNDGGGAEGAHFDAVGEQ
jgi:hypothetical protein